MAYCGIHCYEQYICACKVRLRNQSWMPMIAELWGNAWVTALCTLTLPKQQLSSFFNAYDKAVKSGSRSRLITCKVHSTGVPSVTALGIGRALRRRIECEFGRRVCLLYTVCLFRKFYPLCSAGRIASAIVIDTLRAPC